MLAAVGLLAPLVTTNASSAAPTTSPAGLAGTQPNIVLVVTDDQTIESMRYMPYIQQQTEAGAYINFTQAEVNNPLCCPSRASILTGQVDTRTGVTTNARAGDFRPEETVGLALNSAGYRTGLFGKLFNSYNAESPLWPGWDDFQPVMHKGMYAQYNYQIKNNGLIENYGSTPDDYAVDVLAGKALDFITDTPDDQPLFLYVAPTATHAPYVAAPRHRDYYADTSITLPPNWGERDVSDKPAWVQQLQLPSEIALTNAIRKQYTAALAVDDMVRSIDQQLLESGRMDNTVFIFINDNGLSQGSHRWGSKFCEYASCTAVPLVVRYPGQLGRTETRLASNIDLAPTLVDLAGTSMPVAPDGISLVPALEDVTGTVPTVDGLLSHWPGVEQTAIYNAASVVPGYYGLRTSEWRYVEVTNLGAPDRREYELYDQVNDPWELENQAANPDYDEVEASLKAQMYDLIRATGADPTADQGTWRPKPSVTIDDVSQNEGDSGTLGMTFTVTLTGASEQGATVDYATADGTATAGSDYVATNGTVTFAAGSTPRTQSVVVTVNGDTAFEADETFFVNLTSPVNSTISDAQGQGTIVNDDADDASAVDLAITMSDGPDPVTATANVTYSIVVSNAGLATATNVTVPITLGTTSGVSPIAVSVTPSQGSCTALTCNLGTITAGSTGTISAIVTPIQPTTVSTGPLASSVSVSADQPDLNTANNSASVSTTVKAQPSTNYVIIGDAGFPGASVTANQFVQFNFIGSKDHRITDNAGLLDTGVKTPISFFRYSLQSVGGFVLTDSATALTRATANMNVPVQIRVGTGSTRNVIWGLPIPSGYQWDVTIHRPTDPAGVFTPYLTATNVRSVAFTPDAGPGVYQFEARVYNATTGKASNVSPPGSFTI